MVRKVRLDILWIRYRLFDSIFYRNNVRAWQWVYLGYRSGYRLLYPRKTRTCGMGRQVWSDFKLRSKVRETASSALEIVHFRPPQPPTTTVGEQRRGNGWCIHPFPTKVCCLLDSIHKFWLIQHISESSCSLQPTTLKNEHMWLFLMVVGYSSTPPSHHPRKRVHTLVFNGGWLSFITTNQPPLKTGIHTRF